MVDRVADLWHWVESIPPRMRLQWNKWTKFIHNFVNIIEFNADEQGNENISTSLHGDLRTCDPSKFFQWFRCSFVRLVPPHSTVSNISISTCRLSLLENNSRIDAWKSTKQHEKLNEGSLYTWIRHMFDLRFRLVKDIWILSIVEFDASRNRQTEILTLFYIYILQNEIPSIVGS